MEQALDGGDTFCVVCRLASAQPEPVLCAVAGLVNRAPDGRPISIEGTITPASRAAACTHCREADIQGERKAKELTRNLLSILSHDIRSPLIGAIGMLQLLRRSGLDLKQRQYVTLASDSCESMLDMAKNILDFARIDSGRDTLCLKGMNLPEVAQSVLRLHQEQADRHGVTLVYECLGGFPGELLCDETKFRQVLGNLISNAIRFSEGGSVKTELSCARLPGRGHVVILEVTDTGIGFDMGQMRTMFDQFGQICLDGPARRQGAGLGLTIVKGLVELFEGALCAESHQGDGASFYVSFPAMEAQDEVNEK